MIAATLPAYARSGAVPDHTRNEIYNEEHQLAQAETDQNHGYFERKLDDKLIYVAYNGLVFTKQQLVRGLNYIDVRRYKIENMKVRQLGPDAGLATYDLILIGNIAGRSMPAKQYASSVWLKTGGQWKLIFHQSTPADHR